MVKSQTVITSMIHVDRFMNIKLYIMNTCTNANRDRDHDHDHDHNHHQRQQQQKQQQQKQVDEETPSISEENTKIKFVPCTICSEPGCSTSKQTTTITIKVITVVIR